MTPWLQLSIRLSSLECLGVSRFFQRPPSLAPLSLSLFISLSLHKPLNRPQTRSRIRCPLSLVFVRFFFDVPTKTSGISSLPPSSPSRADSRWNDVWMADRGWENLDAGRRWLAETRAQTRLVRRNSSYCRETRGVWRLDVYGTTAFVVRSSRMKMKRVQRNNNKGREK